MTSSFDALPSIHTSLEQKRVLPRLFNADLPYLTQRGQPFPELVESVPLDSVLDIASGTGEWALAAGQAVPQVQIVGIENDAQQVEQAHRHAQSLGIKNVTFTQLNPFQPLDLPENAFDLVNARYIVGLLPVSDWPGVLKEFVRVTRPKGILRLTETDLPITNSAAVEQLSSWIAQAYSSTKRSFSPTGRLLSITPMLKGLLQDAGCQQVQQVVWNINFSMGMPAHAEVTQDLDRTYRLVLPFLVSVGVAPQEEIEQVYQRMFVDMQSERFTATVLSLTVWGIKL